MISSKSSRDFTDDSIEHEDLSFLVSGRSLGSHQPKKLNCTNLNVVGSKYILLILCCHTEVVCAVAHRGTTTWILVHLLEKLSLRAF